MIDKDIQNHKEWREVATRGKKKNRSQLGEEAADSTNSKGITEKVSTGRTSSGNMTAVRANEKYLQLGSTAYSGRQIGNSF